MKQAAIQSDPVTIAKALADDGRLRILAALRDGELCVCQIVELIDLAPSTISKHLAILAAAKLILGRKDGRWVHYRLNRPTDDAAIGGALGWAIDSIMATETGMQDARRLRRIVTIKPEVLCCRQRQTQ